MSDERTSQGELSPIKRALIDLRALRTRVAELESRDREPLAIVGMSVRAPGGVTDIAGFERQLWAGIDAITEVPESRWPIERWFDAAQDTPGKMSTRHGGFLGDVDGFDADLFNIAPVEAASMDPQQRLALELAWEAIEHAGIAPSALAGSPTGVYLGISNSDYARQLFSNVDHIDPYFSSGTAYSVAAGRIAYVLDLRGPAVAVDTACSSSLVALHLACQALRRGDCELALVGGVNLMLSPELSVNFSKAGMMSSDGRCHTFDAAANGYVRGEGGGFVLLRRLADAESDGSRILAMVRGTAINQDGRSNGLTAPNGRAQQAVIKAALAAGGVAPRLVSYVEAHGTGTPLGDPIEVGALTAVLGDARDADDALALGSVKTNIGHLEAAAGVVGLIKTVLALGRREIPPNLHFTQPNPLIDWNALPLTIPTSPMPWSPIEGRWIAGVSSFGFSGTNAHAVLEAAPDAAPSPWTQPSACREELVLALSARQPAALRALATRYRDMLRDMDGGDTATLRDLCYTANTGRSHFGSRLSVRGSSPSDFSTALTNWIAGADDPRAIGGTESSTPPRVAFLFPGQGPQYVQMGRRLYDCAPTFRRAFDESAAALEPFVGRALTSIVFPGPADDANLLERTEYAQPAMFVIEYALAALWRSWGVEPIAVMGHSFGEYAAAAVAGVLSLDDAARMVAARGRIASTAPGDGLMMVVEASEAEMTAALEGLTDRAAIAAVNGPRNVVVSGERGAVKAVAGQFASRGRRSTALRVSHAFHSPLMDPVLDSFEREIASVSFQAPRTAVISNLTGATAELDTLGRTAYWRDHLRHPVRFAQSLQELVAKGVTHYIEMSPHPVLLGMGAECVTGGVWLPSLRRDQSAWSEMLGSLQVLYVDGQPIDWASVKDGQPHRRIALPSYPFQRRRHWIDAGSPADSADTTATVWPSLVRRMDREAERGPLDLNPASYASKWECLDRVASAQIQQTLSELGAFRHQGERHSVDSLLQHTGITETHRRLLARWIDRLVVEGILVRDGVAFIATAAMVAGSFPSLWAEAERNFADNREYLAYVRHCADHLTEIVTGRESALESLFPGGSFDLAIALYERSATMRYANGLAAAAVESAVQVMSGRRAVRVLEIGGGTGGTTSSILAALPGTGVCYRFTDVSGVFLDAARARLEYPFLETSTFDLEVDPAAQGLVPGSIDIVVSANAVHAVRDLRVALAHLRALLAPGGLLVLVETTTHHGHFDITTGLIEGWQHFDDTLRTDVPLLPPSRWTEALRDAGFAEATAWPAAGTPQSALAQHVVVAQAPGQWRATTAPNEQAAAGRGDVAETVAADSVVESLRARLDEALPSERHGMLIDIVRTEVMRILRLEPSEEPGRHERLMELGMDSLMAVQLRNALNTAVEPACGLPSTLMFDYPTIDAMAGYLLAQIAPASVEPTTRTPVADHRDIGVPLKAEDIAALSDDEIASLLLDREERG